MSNIIWIVSLALIAIVNIILGIMKIKDQFIPEGLTSFAFTFVAIALIILIFVTKTPIAPEQIIP